MRFFLFILLFSSFLYSESKDLPKASEIQNWIISNFPNYDNYSSNPRKKLMNNYEIVYLDWSILKGENDCTLKFISHQYHSTDMKLSFNPSSFNVHILNFTNITNIIMSDLENFQQLIITGVIPHFMKEYESSNFKRESDKDVIGIPISKEVLSNFTNKNNITEKRLLKAFETYLRVCNKTNNNLF